MGWKHVNAVLLTKRPRWRTAQQQMLLLKWAQHFRKDWGYAVCSWRRLTDELGPSRGTLLRLTRQLEDLGVGGRLPCGDSGDKNKYWIDVDAFEDRRRQDLGPPEIAGLVRERRGALPTLPEVQPSQLWLVDPTITSDHPPDHQRSGDPDHQRSGTPITSDRGSVTELPLYQQDGEVPSTRTVPGTVLSSTGTATTAAQPRLNALMEAIRKKRNQRLASEPAADSNFKQVCRAVRDVLCDPGLAARVLKDYDATKDGDVREAARRLAAARHVLPPGIEGIEMVGRALEWERTRFTILAGEPRPRDKRRGR